MFYLMMHLTHFILGLYVVRHIMIKEISNSKRGKLLPPLHGLLFPVSSKGSFICTISDKIAHMAFG